MYTIGQFSRIGRVSAKTLRFYDEIGLIKPVQVDKWNSYRYYSAEQVPEILLINELKGFGFSLEEIKELMRAKDPDALAQAMQIKFLDLKKELERVSETASRVESKLKHIKEGGAFMDIINSFNIEIKERNPQVICGIRKKAGLEEMCNVINELCAKFQKHNVKVCGPMMTFYYDQDFNPEYTDYEVCMPVVEASAKGVEGTREVPGGKNACTLYTGPYPQIGTAYAAVMKWIDDNGYTTDGAPYEVYLVGPDQTQDESKYVTEVCYPVIK